jgi:hypothetical protein
LFTFQADIVALKEKVNSFLQKNLPLEFFATGFDHEIDKPEEKKQVDSNEQA